MLEHSRVSKNALFPRVLRRGTSTYPDMRKISQRLEELYGSRLLTDVSKVGEYQIVVFGVDMVAGQFVGIGDSLMTDGLRLLNEVITSPVASAGQFDEGVVEQEKDALTKQIRAIINDKAQYSVVLLIEEMFRGEPYGIHPLGKIEHIKGLCPRDLYAHYSTFVRDAPVDIFAVGNFDAPTLLRHVSDLLHLEPRDTNGRRQKTQSRESPREPREIVERQPVSQAKLTMGFRTNTMLPDDEVYPMMMFEGILGGFPHSKLFLNVREKHGLAYYAHTTLDNSRGVMLIVAGIDESKYEQARQIIAQQIDLMKKGEFTDFEIDTTRRGLVNRMRSCEDSTSALIGMWYEQVLSGKPIRVDQRIDQILGVTKQQIVQAAERVQLDTTYFLAPRGGDS